MASTRSGSDDFVFPVSGKLVLPESLRSELRVLLEPIVQEDALGKAVAGVPKVAAVGDLCSLTAVKRGIRPDICIVDFQTKRKKIDGKQKARVCGIGTRCVKVKNPAAQITRELWDAVFDAYSSPEKTRIEVEGEEDLAAIVCLHAAPRGTAVIYGIPDMGLEVVHVNERAKEFAGRVLRRMTVV